MEYKYIPDNIDDLLFFATFKGKLNVNGKQPIHSDFSSLIMQKFSKEGGVDNIKIVDSIQEGIPILEVEDLKGKRKYIKGEFVAKEVLCNKRIIIYPVHNLEDNSIRDTDRSQFYKEKYLEDRNLKSSRLIIIPIQKPGHFTVFIIDHQNKEGYYFDPFGVNEKFFEQYCKKTLKYNYKYNTKKVQFDGVSCGPISVEFIFHVINCIKKNFNAKISADKMPEFRPKTKAHKKMIEKQKALSSSILNPQWGAKSKANLNVLNYMVQHYGANEVEEHIENSVNNSRNLPYLLAITLGSVFGGGILGYSITRVPIINQVITSFLADNFRLEKAEIIFSVSSILLCAGIIGVIGYVVGNYALENA